MTIVGGEFVGRGKHAVSGERNLLVRLVDCSIPHPILFSSFFRTLIVIEGQVRGCTGGREYNGELCVGFYGLLEFRRFLDLRIDNIEDPGNQEIRMQCNTPLSLSAVVVNQTSPIILS